MEIFLLIRLRVTALYVFTHEFPSGMIYKCNSLNRAACFKSFIQAFSHNLQNDPVSYLLIAQQIGVLTVGVGIFFNEMACMEMMVLSHITMR